MALIAEPCFRVTDSSINETYVEVKVREISDVEQAQRYVQIEQDGSVIEVSRDMAADLRDALTKIITN